ncbi:MAG: hypothetical protein ABI679_00420 [Gemmatimonadota bacterium]
MIESEREEDEWSSAQAPRARFRHPWHWGRLAGGGYILLVAMAAGYVTYRLAFAGLRSPFVGIIMIILGWPWSRPLGEHFTAHGPLGVGLVLALSYSLNAATLYIVGVGLQRLVRRGR